MWPNPKGTADLVTFTEEILNRKLNFLCSYSLKWCISISKSGFRNILISNVELRVMLLLVSLLLAVVSLIWKQIWFARRRNMAEGRLSGSRIY